MAVTWSEVERRIAALPERERERRRELLGRAAEAILERPLDDITRHIDELAGNKAPFDLDAARARNIERQMEDQARLVRESIPAGVVRRGMNVSRQRLHQLASQQRLLAIQLQPGGPSLYPFWQFQGTTPVQPYPELARLLAAAHEIGMDTLALHFFMVEPHERIAGRAPHELLAAGDIERAIELLQSAGLGPF
jgi:hypothetical protein